MELLPHATSSRPDLWIGPTHSHTWITHSLATASSSRGHDRRIADDYFNLAPLERHIVRLDCDQSLHQQTIMDRLILSLSASRRHQEIEAICINVWPPGQQSQSDSIFQAGRSVNGVQAASDLHSHYQQSTQMEPVSSASSINQHLHPDGNRHSSSENQSRGDDD